MYLKSDCEFIKETDDSVRMYDAANEQYIHIPKIKSADVEDRDKWIERIIDLLRDAYNQGFRSGENKLRRDLKRLLDL